MTSLAGLLIVVSALTIWVALCFVQDAGGLHLPRRSRQTTGR
jgi:hypothetical protein